MGEAERLLAVDLARMCVGLAKRFPGLNGGESTEKEAILAGDVENEESRSGKQKMMHLIPPDDGRPDGELRPETPFIGILIEK